MRNFSRPISDVCMLFFLLENNHAKSRCLTNCWDNIVAKYAEHYVCGCGGAETVNKHQEFRPFDKKLHFLSARAACIRTCVNILLHRVTQQDVQQNLIRERSDTKWFTVNALLKSSLNAAATSFLLIVWWMIPAMTCSDKIRELFQLRNFRCWPIS